MEETRLLVFFSRWAAYQGLECFKNYLTYCLLGQQECVSGDLTLHPYTITSSKLKYMGGGVRASNDHPGTASDFIYVQVDCMSQTSQMEKCAITIMNIACKSISSDTHNTMAKNRTLETIKSMHFRDVQVDRLTNRKLSQDFNC